MSTDPRTEEIRKLELALDDLRDRVRDLRVVQPGVTPSLPIDPSDPAKRINLDIAQRVLERISQSTVFSPAQATDFKRLAEAAIKESLRGQLGRPPGSEAATTINITVTGTGTISVD